jgi:CHAD domain-containing protein
LEGDDLRLIRLRLRHYARKAVWIVGNPRLDPEESVHELRVLGKRTRALLRLFRHAPSGPAALRAREEAVREGMRRLGPVRDAAVEAALLRRLGSAAGDKAGGPAPLHPPPAMTGLLVGSLAAAEREVAALIGAGTDAGWLPGALQASYRRARRRWQRELRRPAGRHLHAWRIANKALLYQLQALHLRRPVVPPKLLGQLRKIGQALGEARDLSLLAENHGRGLGEKELRVIDKAYARKRNRALGLAAKAFKRKRLALRERPAGFSKKAWRALAADI